MNDLQGIFNRIQETKAKQRQLRAMYKDGLSVNAEYQELLEKLEQLKLRKKQLESYIQAEMEEDYKKMDAYKMHVKTDNELLSDLALNKLMSGETVEVLDKNEQKYEPLFSVKFKKA